MEWLDSLWAWIMSLIASLFTLFTSVFTSVSESHSVEAPMDLSGASEAPKAAEVFEALAAQVPPMLVELSDDAPPNM